MARSMVLAMVVLCGLAKDARADAPRDASERPTADVATPANTEYDTVIARAIQEYALGHFPEAKVFFLRAHALRPSARTLRGLGRTSYELRNYVEATTYLRAALSTETHALSPEMRAEVQSTLEDATSFLSRQPLTVTPPDAQVTVDGHPAVTDEGSLLLDPGSHELRVQAAGYRPEVLSIAANGARLSPIAIVLRKAITTAALRSVPSSPRAGRPPRRGIFASFGTQRILAVALSASGVLALGTGAVLSVLALQKKSDSKANCEGDMCNAAGLEQRKAAVSRADGATISFIAAGALLGTGAILFFTAPRPREVEVGWAPAVGPHHAALIARGRF